MAKNNGQKRVTRKRKATSAPKTLRKPRLAEDAAAELAGTPLPESAPVETTEAAAPTLEVVEDAPPVEAQPVEVLEVAPPATPDAPEIEVAPAPPPPRAVSVWPPAAEAPSTRLEATWPERRFRRIAFVRAVLHRVRLEAERRSAPLVRRVAARFPRLVALRDSIRRWI